MTWRGKDYNATLTTFDLAVTIQTKNKTVWLKIPPIISMLNSNNLDDLKTAIKILAGFYVLFQRFIQTNNSKSKDIFLREKCQFQANVSMHEFLNADYT